jgi:hypothetical protein
MAEVRKSGPEQLVQCLAFADEFSKVAVSGRCRYDLWPTLPIEDPIDVLATSDVVHEVWA